ncbi:Ribonuclease HI [hydrothermal vent metagenome]|uniref:ribonuclease H n=1 Tax=hydrothermal vent metagenome TaxID=652676 RepID=A0A3B0WHB7_9ZZZZ
MNKPTQIHIYSDGSYFEKQNIGGWGAVIFKATPSQKIDTRVPSSLEQSQSTLPPPPFQELSRLSGCKKHTCSLEMELEAACNALQSLKKLLNLTNQKTTDTYQITLFTDSRVLLEGLNKKMPLWRQKKWIHKSGNPVKYQFLWESLDELTQQYQVSWRWVKGHSGNLGNTLADQLAREVNK